MIRESFILLDRVGSETEQRWWRQGITSWDAFRDAAVVRGLGSQRKAFYESQLRRAEGALQASAWGTLARMLPQREHWRLYPLLDGRILYLDIETSGYYGDITVIGGWDGTRFFSFVRGCNLDKQLLAETLAQYEMLVTFNGASFDLPVIERYFSGVIPDGMLHVDLRHVCARVGLRGGLKAIERQLGIGRDEGVAMMGGDDAVMLWHQYRMTQEREFIDLLLAYNEADCRNLEPLAEIVSQALWTDLRRNIHGTGDQAPRTVLAR